MPATLSRSEVHHRDTEDTEKVLTRKKSLSARLRGERLGEVGVDGGNDGCPEPHHLGDAAAQTKPPYPEPPRLGGESKDAVSRSSRDVL
jgi:hypothetical protein